MLGIRNIPHQGFFAAPLNSQIILLPINKRKMLKHPSLWRASTSVGYFKRANLPASNRAQKLWDHLSSSLWTGGFKPESTFITCIRKWILKKRKSNQTLPKIFWLLESHWLQCFTKSVDLPNIFLVFPWLNNFSCVLYHSGTRPVVPRNKLIINNWLNCDTREIIQNAWYNMMIDANAAITPLEKGPEKTFRHWTGFEPMELIFLSQVLPPPNIKQGWTQDFL